MSQGYDAVVVGAGPNGLAAAVLLAAHGCRVGVLEAAEAPGGGVRTEALTRPGFLHDVCSGIHPLGVGSPFLRRLPLAEHGLEWIHAPAPLAHPFADGTAVRLERSLEATARGLGTDGPSWTDLVGPTVRAWEEMAEELLAPLHVPRHPVRMLRFGVRALRSAEGLARSRFEGREARALFAGLAAHSFLPLDRMASAAVGLVLGAAGHAVGWPMAAGGAGRIADALVGCLEARGGEVHTGRPVRGLEDLPPARAVLFDLTPRQLLQIAGNRLPARYRRRLAGYRYGPGAFKLDWALREPIPWRAEACARAGTVHLGGPLEEVAASERATWRGRVEERPFVLLAQHSLFDPARAPEGRHTAWAYCHVPHAWDGDATRRIEAQVERFAPGFRDVVLERHVLSPAALERRNANLVGGDINGGVQDLRQLFTRPVARLVPYQTPEEAFYICSSSTPPGGGVHGMCGYFAARAALRRSFGIDPVDPEDWNGLTARPARRTPPAG